ncbi:MAG: tetratricopeptide repeat protein [Rhodoferax sp.]|nr:tetratricopeptide repeat protein [Rhodoferax sp.]
MFRKILLVLAVTLTAAFVSLPVLAATEPSMREVYQAAQEGRFIEAQSMMDQVLKEHPNSAKAHYVQAELLAKQGLVSRADTELRTAERLEPGLAFAKSDAVSKLKAVIAAPRASSNVQNRAQPSQSGFAREPAAEKGISWGLVAGGLGLIAFIVFATRFMRQRSAAAMPAAGYAGTGNSYGANPAMQPQPYGGPPMGGPPMGGPGMAPAAGGMGSGIMGGLATGAALGAGMVAGQALMHRFTDGDRGNSAAPAQSGNNWNPEPAPNDMGGNDFGVADSSSWDDGGSGGDGGGGDWN